MKNIFLLLILTFALICCKQNKRNYKQNKDEFLVKNENQRLKVLINAKVLINDYFEVYYYEPGLDTFSSNDYILTEVIGNEDSQDISFILPKDIFPERLRLDFGKTSEQKEIQLNSIKLIFGDKTYEFSQDEIINQFKASKFIDFDVESFTIETREIENRYDPYFYTPKLNNIVNYLRED